MKRILIIAVFIFSFMFVMAQTSNKHFTFKGIPITGTLESFAQKMEAKGLKKYILIKPGSILKVNLQDILNVKFMLSKFPIEI